MSGFWREVFDFSESAETPARMKASVQVGVAVGALGLVLITVIGFVTSWSNPVLINLLVLPLVGFALAGGSYYRLRQDRRRRAGRRRRARQVGSGAEE